MGKTKQSEVRTNKRVPVWVQPCKAKGGKQGAVPWHLRGQQDVALSCWRSRVLTAVVHIKASKVLFYNIAFCSAKASWI